MSLQTPPRPDAEIAHEIKDAASKLNALILAAQKDGIFTDVVLFQKTDTLGISNLVDVTVNRRL